ncbi:hypothetical protein ACMFMF_009939 [Clarireedia jacksonii]
MGKIRALSDHTLTITFWRRRLVLDTLFMEGARISFGAHDEFSNSSIWDRQSLWCHRMRKFYSLSSGWTSCDDLGFLWRLNEGAVDLCGGQRGREIGSIE